MTKGEFYGALINTTMNTGQGVPLILFKGQIRADIMELVEEKKVKLVEKTFNHFNNDVFVCLMNIYCVEEHINDNMQALSFMRRYLGIDQTNDVPFKMFHNKTPEQAYTEWETGSQEEYDKWKIDNKEGLDAIDNLPTNLDKLVSDIDNFSEEFLDFIKSKDWYRNNVTATEALEFSNDKISNLTELIRVHNELLRLYKSDSVTMSKYANEIIESEKELKEIEKELQFRNKIKLYLTGVSNAYVQAIIY